MAIRRFLITGATGFVGGWLQAELYSAYPDAGFWGTTHRAENAFSLPSVHLLPCDLTDAGQIENVVQEVKPTDVFHLAGFASGAGGDADMIYRSNVDGTLNLLRSLKRLEQSPVRVLLASSGYVYGATKPGRPAQENDPLNPKGAYAESKAVMERETEPFGSDSLQITVTRSFNHSGPRQGIGFVVPAFARQIARIERGEEPPIVRVGNLAAERDFLHVRDVVRAYRLLLEDSTAGWRVFNVASGIGVPIQSLLDVLVAESRVPVSVEQDPNRMRPSDLAVCVGDPARLIEKTGWHPHHAIGEMLRETLQWWRDQPGDSSSPLKPSA